MGEQAVIYVKKLPGRSDGREIYTDYQKCAITFKGRCIPLSTTGAIHVSIYFVQDHLVHSLLAAC